MGDGKHFAVFVCRQRWPAAIHRRNLGRGIQPFAFIARQYFTQQAVALAFTVSPGGIEEITTLLNRHLHRLQRFLIFGTAPAAHAPQSMSDVTHVETAAPQLAIFHLIPSQLLYNESGWWNESA